MEFLFIDVCVINIRNHYSNFSKNNFGSLLAVPIGDFVLQSDGYIINETDSVLGRLYGSNTDSIGFYVYGKNRFFVKKGMRVNASASGLYFIPFNDWYNGF